MMPENGVGCAKVMLHERTHLNTGEDFCRTSRLAFLDGNHCYGPFPTSSTGNKDILVASNYFTRWVEAYGISNQEATTVAKTLIENMFCRFSIPRQLYSDQGAQFKSGLIKELSKMHQINKTRPTPYHPQSDRLVL